jgi:hypothetical protein
MKRMAFFLLLIVGLCDCNGLMMVGGDNYLAQLDTRRQAIWAWATTEKGKVDAGTLKNSDFWKLFFRKTMELRPDLDDYLSFAKEMIKVSRIFEEGKITREQFEDKNRQLTTLLGQEESRRTALFHIQMHYSEEALFTCYRSSLFLNYISSLQRQLSQAGPQMFYTHCDIFGNSIQCTTLNPSFP